MNWYSLWGDTPTASEISHHKGMSANGGATGLSDLSGNIYHTVGNLWRRPTLKLIDSQLNLPHGTKHRKFKKKTGKEQKTKTELLRNGSGNSRWSQSWWSYEESLRWEGFMNQVRFKLGMKEWESYGWREWRINRIRWCDRRRKRSVRDGEMKIGWGQGDSEWVDSRDKVRRTERSDRLYVTRMMLVVERGWREMNSECCKNVKHSRDHADIEVEWLQELCKKVTGDYNLHYISLH